MMTTTKRKNNPRRQQIEERKKWQKEAQQAAISKSRHKMRDHGKKGTKLESSSDLERAHHEEAIIELFLYSQAKSLFLWKQVKQGYYYSTLFKLERLPEQWNKISEHSKRTDKFLHFCQPYIEYLPYFFEDLCANVNEGFVLRRFVYVHQSAYVYFQAYVELQQYLDTYYSK